MPVFFTILRVIRAFLRLVFAPSPITEKGKINAGDALLIGKDTTAAFGAAALLVLFAKAFGVNISGDESEKVVESFIILMPLFTAIVSTVVRWFQDTKPNPLPSPPPNPLPPPGVREENPFEYGTKTYPRIASHDTTDGDEAKYDFESRPPGGGPHGPKK